MPSTNNASVDALLDALRKNAKQNIESANIAAVPGLVDRGLYTSPVATKITGRNAANIMGNLNTQMADILYRNAQEEANRDFTREGWRNQTNQAALGRDWQSGETRTARAYSELVRQDERRYAEQVAKEIAAKQEEQAKNDMWWNIGKMALGAGVSMIPGIGPIAGGGMLKNALAGALMGPGGIGNILMGRLGGQAWKATNTATKAASAVSPNALTNLAYWSRSGGY